MSFLNFANELYVKTFDSTEAPRMGSFSLATSGELQYIRTVLFINGVSSLGGSEQVRIKLYGDSDHANLLYTSAWSSISDITDIGSTNWIGYFRLDFSKENLNANITYYVSIETQNYTRNADTFYLGVPYDFPFPIYDNSQDLFVDHPLAMQIFTWQDRV